MAITPRAVGAWAYAASGSVTPTLPTHASGDMLLVRVAYKSSAIATCTASTATSGWAKVSTEYHSGTTNSGNGTGSMAMAVFWKAAASASETNPTITFSQAVTQVGHVAVSYQKDAGETWSTPLGDGGLFGGGTGVSITIASHVPATAGDLVDAFMAFADDTAVTNTALSQSGITWVALSARYPTTAGIDTSGADGAYDGAYRIASSGSSSAAGAMSGGLSVSETGAGWHTRLRVTAANQLVTPTTAALVATKFAPTVTASDHQLVTVPTAGGAGYAAAVLADSPVAYYRLGEPSGTTMTDDVGSLDGTYYTTPTLGVTGALSGDSNTAVTFNGTDEYAQIGDNAAFDTGDVVSVECWFKRARTGVTEILVSKGNSSYAIAIYASNAVYFTCAGVADFCHTSVTVTDTAWHHVVATKNGATRKIYLDGADVTTLDGSGTLTNTSQDVAFASSPFAGGNFFQGSLDELAIYNTALSAARVLAHYTAGTTPGGLVLTGYAPTVTLAAPQLVTPTTATVVLATFAPAVTFTDNQLVTPTTKAAVVATFAPTVTATDLQLVTPTTKALSLTTFAPLVSTPERATPSTVSLALTTFAPSISVTDNQAVTPTTKALTLATFAPTVTATDPQLVTPTTKAVTLTTFAPTVTAAAHQQVTPTTVALSLQAFAPTVTATDQQAVTPTTKALTLAAFAPTVLTPELVTPATKALALTTFAPTVSNPDPQLVTPTTASLITAKYAPSVGVSDAASIVPPNASLSLTTYAPTVIQPDPQLVTPTTPALELHTFGPVVTATAHQAVIPTTAVLVTTRHIPTVVATANQSAIPSTKALTLTTHAPQVRVNNIVATVTIGLTLSTFAPSVTAGTNSYAFPDPASLTLTGYAPFIDLSAFKLVTPATAVLVITTYPPTAEQHSITPLPTPIYGFAVIATGPGAGVGSANGGATVTTSEGGSTAVSSSGPSARVTIR